MRSISTLLSASKITATDVESLAGEQRVERFGLRDRARKTVDDHVLDVREFGFDHVDDRGRRERARRASM